MSNQNIKRHLDLLGLRARDKVTNLEGIMTSVSFDLYGCVQVVISAPVGDDGKIPDGVWLDINRLEILSNTVVMPVPDFDEGYVAEANKGAAEKPLP